MMDPIAAWPVGTTTSGSAARLRKTWEDTDAMKGLMMDYPLTLTQFFERTRRFFHRTTMATRVPGVGLQWNSYRDYADRGSRLAGSPGGLGAAQGGGGRNFARN